MFAHNQFPPSPHIEYFLAPFELGGLCEYFWIIQCEQKRLVSLSSWGNKKHNHDLLVSLFPVVAFQEQ